MNAGERSALITRTLHNEHPEPEMSGDLEVKLKKAVALLPDDGLYWTTSSDGAAVHILSETTLFRIELRIADDDLEATSTRLDAASFASSVAWGPSSTDEAGNTRRQTAWTFSQGDPPARLLQIAGTVYTAFDGDHYDQREMFARVLAHRAGWGSPPSPESLAQWFASPKM